MTEKANQEQKLVTNEAICEEKKFVYKGRTIFGYMPLVEGVEPQFEVVKRILEEIPGQPGQKVQLDIRFFVEAKNVAEAFVLYDTMTEQRVEEAKTQFRRQAMGMGVPAGGNGRR